MLHFTLIWNGEKHDIEVANNSETEDLLKESVRISKVHINRIRLYFLHNKMNIPLQPHQPLSCVPSQLITVIDSGPQFSFMMNDLFEYIPPIFIWLAMLYLQHSEPNEYIEVATVLWLIHFVKRSFEAVFVHTYSQRTLPIFSLLDNSCFKNCIYYWAFAFMISFSIVENWNFVSNFPNTQSVGINIFIVSELLNGYCHLALRKLRPKGSLGHFLPKGFLFNQITCPNYTFEILAWIGFALFTQRWVCFVFPIIGGVQMFYWADEKRNKLATKYPEVKKRGRITPFSFL